MKAIHLNKRVYSIFHKKHVMLPICKVHNKTYAYNATTKKEKVTCKNCLDK
jgi:hypothetical protein